MPEPEPNRNERELLRASLPLTLGAFAVLVTLSGTAALMSMSVPLMIIAGVSLVGYMLIRPRTK